MVRNRILDIRRHLVANLSVKLNFCFSTIEKQSAQKDAENKILQREIDELNERIENEKDPNKDSVIFDIVDNQPQRMQRIMRRNRVISKIKVWLYILITILMYNQP